MRRLLRRALLFVTVAIIGIVVAGMFARVTLARSVSEPGKMIDVGGYRMHLHCTGTGEPTVILEAGLLDFSLFWSRVQPTSAALARTCSYDRAGLGWSDASSHVRSSGVMVEELRSLMSRAGERPPFVLVGHSFGGMNARLYAQRHPQEIAGLVLVDAAHEDQWDRLPELEAASTAVRGQFRLLAWLQRGGMLAFARSSIPDRGLPAAAAVQYRTLLATSDYFATAVKEVEGLEESVAELRATRDAAVVDRPVIVISRGLPAPLPGLAAEDQDRVERVWRELQRDLAAAAPLGAHLIAESSSHDVHLQQPELVSEAIERVIEAWRRNRSDARR